MVPSGRFVKFHESNIPFYWIIRNSSVYDEKYEFIANDCRTLAQARAAAARHLKATVPDKDMRC